MSLLITLAGFCDACQTAAQHQAQVIRSTNQAASAEARSCERAVYALPEFDTLRRHFPPIGEHASLEQLTDSSYATEEEIKALYAEHPKSNACRQQFLARLAPVLPTIVPILAEGYSRSENSLIDLIQRKETWGDHTRRVKQIEDEVRPQLVAEGHRIDAGLERSHEAELSRRERAAAAIAQFVQTQEMINAGARPIVTTCNSFGRSATCVTQ